MADVGPVAAGFWRVGLATPVLLAVAVGMHGARGTMRAASLVWPGLALAGVAFALDLGSWHMGIHHTTMANAALFGNAATFTFPIYGFFVARRWPTPVQALALVLAGGGAALLLGRSAELSADHLLGDLLCLGAGMLYTFYFIGMARARTRLGPISALGLASAIAAPGLLFAALALGERVMPGNWWPVVALAVSSQLIGQGLMIYALGHLSPLVIGIALLLQPIVAGATGWALYGERPGPVEIAGAVLIAVALVLVRRPPRAKPAADFNAGENTRKG